MTMKYFVGVTDNNWFNFLSSIKPDEVNFWRPSGISFKSIDIGLPFLFKLHSPLNYIVGGGFFIKSEILPLSLAWDAFGEKNGASNINILKNAINQYRKETNNNPEIGCIILNEPFFFERKDWIPIPKNWSKNIVSGKSYNTSDSIGLELWNEVQERLSFDINKISDQLEIYGEGNRYGKAYISRSRLGQGAFRVLVADAYHRRCAITAERTLPVLEAAHIKDFSEEGPNRVDNGILLRSDLHKLFDKGYLTITTDYNIEVSRRLKEEFENGKIYYPYHGKQIKVIPETIEERPSKEYLIWHNNNRYNG